MSFKQDRALPTSHGKPAAAAGHAHSVTLEARWLDVDTRQRGVERLTFSLQRPLTDTITDAQRANSRALGPFRRTKDSGALRLPTRLSAQRFARAALLKAHGELDFVNATGLRPSAGHHRAFPATPDPYRIAPPDLDPCRVPGQDHLCSWFDPTSRCYLLTMELYATRLEATFAARQAWCEHFGYDLAQPTWPGSHNLEQGTRLLLMASRTKGAPLGPVVEALNALPVLQPGRPWPGSSEITDLLPDPA